MSFSNGVSRFDRLSIVRAEYVWALPSLKTGCGRYKHCRPLPGCSVRKAVLASCKPPSNVDGEETTDEATAFEASPAETQSQSLDSEMRARNSVWQSLKLRLPIVGSWFGGRNAAPVPSEDEYTEIKWGGILDPTPDNLLALLLTGLLGLAALQIFWQLFLVAVTITLAALKYSVIAAILLALLIVFL